MEQTTMLTDFGNAMIFIIGGLIFIFGGLLTYWIVSPRRPSEQKGEIYECGEDTVGDAWGNFNIRFYIVALIFLLFDVEIAFLFPWATVFGNAELIEQTNDLWGWFSLFEMTVFVLVLALGLVYAWVKGYLEWEVIKINKLQYKGVVPEQYYEAFNDKIKSAKVTSSSMKEEVEV